MDAEVKQRRRTEKQFAWVGGGMLPLRNWYSPTVGTGGGRLPVAARPAPTGPRPSASALAKASDANCRTLCRRCTWNTLLLHPR